jgi:hypothetical protein
MLPRRVERLTTKENWHPRLWRRALGRHISSGVGVGWKLLLTETVTHPVAPRFISSARENRTPSSLSSSCSLSVPMHMGACRDREGWSPVSDLRSFDLTPCFEEGIILSTLLVVLLILGAYRSWSLRSLPVTERSRKSIWILRAKLVR